MFCCCRAETWMIEFEGRGPVQAGHERFDNGTGPRRQIMNARAGQRFDRGLGLQRIDRLVYVHHQEMKAVAAVPVARE